MSELMRQARGSSDRPRLNAFCRVAPSDRFNVRAMLDAFVFFQAAVFKVRTPTAIHARRRDFLPYKHLRVSIEEGELCNRRQVKGKQQDDRHWGSHRSMSHTHCEPGWRSG